jgi:glycerophosphoryl diester phosphodiesterase/N-acetylneuraminic acid mutarotase
MRAFAALACLLTAATSPAAEGTASPAVAAAGVTEVIGHMGSCADRPGNTLASIRRAIEAGAHVAEVDVRTTKDGALVCMHDPDVDRTTDGKGAVADLTLAQVQALDAGAKFDAKFKGERVPTFRAVLELAKGKIAVMIDLKESGDGYARAVAAAVTEFGEPKRVVIGVRSVADAERFRKLLPDARQIGLIPTTDDIEDFAKAGVQVIRLWPKWLADATLVSRVRKARCELHLGTGTGTKAEVLPLLVHRPESLASDDPAQLLKTLAELRNGWERLPPLPDREGFAGSFAGVSGGALLVAGGANFPDKKPWEGGAKRWTDRVFVLEKPGGTWKVAGTLPRPLGYGVSVTHRGAVVCVGGGDAERHYADAFKLEWRDGRLVTSKLPPLPKALANCSGALVGDVLYVAGGIEKPDSVATERAGYALDLSTPEARWQELPPCPGGGRMLALAAAFDGAFYLAGGADLVAAGGKVERRYRTDAYRYTPAGGWKRVADLPAALVGAPSPAPADARGFFALGGDDGTQVAAAPDGHRGFRTAVLRYDAARDVWAEMGELPAPRVTTPCVRWGEWWVVPGGEVRPGVRSPEVWGVAAFAKK